MKLPIDEITEDIRIRLEKAVETHREERKMDIPDIRTKESAWGKMVAYAHCLKLLSQLDLKNTKIAIKDFYKEIGVSDDRASTIVRQMVAIEKRVRKRDDEMSCYWDNYLSRIETYENRIQELELQIKELNAI